MGTGSEKIYFAGAEKVDWALNEDLRLLKASLPGLTETGQLGEATVAHSVWWGGLLELPREGLAGKKIVCQFDNPPFHWAKQASFRDARSLVGLWVVQSREAEAQASTLQLETHFVPYKVNTEVFRPLDSGARAAIRASLGIPASAFMIGNFHRDTEGGDLTRPKAQKAPEFLLELASALAAGGVPVHCLLAGPRRHWLRAALAKGGIPFTFVGEPVSCDDIKTNILPRARVAELYGALDLCVVTSRWEGGPYSLLEAAATLTPVLSTRVGLAGDLLEPGMIFGSLGEAVEKARAEWQDRALGAKAKAQLEKVRRTYTVEAVRPQMEGLAARLSSVKPYLPAAKNAERPEASKRSGSLSLWAKGKKALGLTPRPYAGLTVSIFREFQKPPYGGGNQFMLALKDAFEKKGVRVLVNEVADSIDGYFFDSLWFDEKLVSRLEKLHRPVVVHRIDGPIHLYRGKDKELDDRIFGLNSRLATSTVIQSDFTLEKVYGTGYRPVRPVVIRNAANPEIFHPATRTSSLAGRRLRLIATSWSDNPNKGGPVYKWLEENLDWSKYEFTFVGRCSEKLSKARVIDPVPSEELAALLNAHDIYLTASQNDPCSNALIEAMSCGLPALALRSGGHPELVGFGGLCFDRKEELPDLLAELRERHDAYRRLVRAPRMEEVADRYLQLVREP